VNAIKNYQLGIDKSTLNGMDKAICQIKLGDIYFTMRDYVKAQPCFSGALAGIQKEYRDYERVSKLSAILDELVVHVEAVYLQDSLQALAKLPEAERLAIIDKKIEEVKKEEEEAKALAEKEAYLAEQEAKGTGIDRPGTETNAVVLPNASDSIGGDLSAVAADDPHTREYYLQQLPFTQEDIDASNIIIIDGLYNMAMIYKDKLEDIPLSVEAFENLERRFPDNEHRLESYYQVYLMALKTGNTVLATEYKNKLMNAFPESDYAVAVADPNYEYNIRMMDVVQDSIYQATYDRYLESDTAYVRKSFRYVYKKYPHLV
jgi:tetratricopeptide (TPR) repeat protein